MVVCLFPVAAFKRLWPLGNVSLLLSSNNFKEKNDHHPLHTINVGHRLDSEMPLKHC